MKNDPATALLKSLRAGRVALHPTDSLPGLTFDPTHATGVAALEAIKGERQGKGFIGLVDSVDTAMVFWEPLPGDWEKRLRNLWPAPLSVIWKPSRRAPKSLLAPDGTLALRVPALGPGADWFADVLVAAAMPLPTTSVNRVGEPAARGWREAITTLGSDSPVFVPSLDNETIDRFDAALRGSPSTLIKILADGSFQTLRQGALECHALIPDQRDSRA